MNLKLHKSKIEHPDTFITITGSKSESNRLLLLQALYPEIKIHNLSNSDDTQVMLKALNSNESFIDIHHAGTAMRFLTAYFAVKDGSDVTITGSPRMKERPIKVLIDALNKLGADISYLENDGCPPLKIRGTSQLKNEVTLKANVSSQYISALLLIAPKLKDGLKLKLDGDITSLPYIHMTLALLEEIGVVTSFDGDIIRVDHKPEVDNHQITVESDWSSASYFYSLVALSEIGTSLTLSSYKKDSLQGDSVLSDLYKNFGVETSFETDQITITKIKRVEKSSLKFNLKSSPDIAQTIAVTSFGLGLGCHLTGLHTLKIKETDRLLALKTELEKLGAAVEITENSLTLHAATTMYNDILIQTYNDHRMAMSFAPLALKIPLQIEDAMVVSKSYPTFWEDLKAIGIKITK